jgi:hypothetical protein
MAITSSKNKQPASTTRRPATPQSRMEVMATTSNCFRLTIRWRYVNQIGSRIRARLLDKDIFKSPNTMRETLGSWFWKITRCSMSIYSLDATIPRRPLYAATTPHPTPTPPQYYQESSSHPYHPKKSYPP